MPLFDSTGRLSTDACATRLKDRGNEGIAAYQFGDFRDFSSTGWRHPREFSSTNRNLWLWDGYGVDRSTLDSDSALRYSEMTHTRCKRQLPQRVFHAVPDLGRSQGEPSIESGLQNGLDTSGARSCNRLAERDFDRFDPGVKPVDVSHVIPQWTNGGVPSREITRSPQFLENLGYQRCDGVWQRSACRTHNK